MSSPSISGAESLLKAVLVVVDGVEQREVVLETESFTIGRKSDNNLVLTDPSVSRDHAVIVQENGVFVIVDRGSRHGTCVNGSRIQRQTLKTNDRIDFGVGRNSFAIFRQEQEEGSSSARQFLTEISQRAPGTTTSVTSDLEQLTLFLEAARKLNTSGVLEDVLVTLLDSTLRITRAERGFIFLRQPDGTLKLAVGRDAKGHPVLDDNTISRSVLRDASDSAAEFIVGDTLSDSGTAGRESIVAHNLRSIVCIPFRKRIIQERQHSPEEPIDQQVETRGVLYLDSHYYSANMSVIGHDILRAIANDAASLVENAYLVQAEEAARRYRQELAIAATIQQHLLAVRIPDCPFAKVRARNFACKDIGGDFFDVVSTDEGLYFVLTDVSGKGITAALLASIMQGMIYSQFVQKLPLLQVVSSVNRFLYEKELEGKYATLVVGHLRANGELELVNCGHVPPLLARKGTVSASRKTNLPVGLFPVSDFESEMLQLQPGDRLVVVTDGVTEAENAEGEFFGDDRLAAAAAAPATLEDSIMSAISEFCSGTPLNDDCSVFELEYKGL